LIALQADYLTIVAFQRAAFELRNNMVFCRVPVCAGRHFLSAVRARLSAELLDDISAAQEFWSHRQRVSADSYKK
jgi:hypothetical protein